MMSLECANSDRIEGARLAVMYDVPAASEDSRSPLSSELLGFPPNARVLIVNSDDFGMYHSVNVAVIRSIEDGIASSCSLMVPCPWALHAAHLLREQPEIRFGVHLTLVCDPQNYRWRPVSARKDVPSLLDDDGELFSPAGIPRLLTLARSEEVEREFRAQVEAVFRAGLSPTHLDWHCLADGGREDLLEVTVSLAKEYGLAVRIWSEAARRRLRRAGLPVVDHDFLDSFSLDLDRKAAKYAQLLQDLPAGLTEWAVHPGLGDDEARAIDDSWSVRRSDYEFLVSPEALDLVRRERIRIIDYSRLQQMWCSTIPR